MKDIKPNCIKIGEVEGTDLIELSVSRLKTWRRCQVKHDFKYVDKLRPKRKAVPLRRGSWVHSCLEARNEGKNWVDVIKQLKADEYDKLFAEEKAELGDLPTEVFRIMRAYHQTYAKVDLVYETIAAEQQFMIRLGKTPFVLTGVIDRIMRNKTNGQIWCQEYKTMKRLPSEDYRLSDIQTTVYVQVLQYLAPYLGYNPKDVMGVIIDYICTKPPTIPDVLKSGELSRRKIFCDRWTYLACLKREGLDPADYEDFLERLDENKFFYRIPMTRSRDMLNNVFKELLITGQQIKNFSGRRVSRSLDWTCDRPKCEYRDLCLAQFQGLDTHFLIESQFTKGGEEVNGKEVEDESDD